MGPTMPLCGMLLSITVIGVEIHIRPGCFGLKYRSRTKTVISIIYFRNNFIDLIIIYIIGPKVGLYVGLYRLAILVIFYQLDHMHSAG